MSPSRQSFRVRHLDEGHTRIDGASRAHGAAAALGVMGMSGLLLLPLSYSVLVGLGATALCAAVGAGYGYRIAVGPGGIVVARTWLGVLLPGSRERAALDAHVYVDDGDDTFAGVTIADHELPMPGRDRVALKEAVLVAVEQAVSWSVAERTGRPYRTRA